jgi:hypothetical protein
MAEPAFTVKMPLVCTVEKGETVPGKPSSFAVVRPKHLWEPTPKAIRITVQARDFELPPKLDMQFASKVFTKSQIFFPARARWSPNQSLTIDLGVEYPSSVPPNALKPWLVIPKCEATYEVARHTRP